MLPSANNKAAVNRSQSTVNHLSEQLAIVARMIKGRLGTKIYMVSLDGLDTHTDQVPSHDNLLQSVADGVNAFFQDLATTNEENRVIALTFSEFGRTTDENDSGGTDHAAAAPVMLFGPNV